MCPSCKGVGHWTKEVCTSYHRGDYDYINYLCDVCEGSGLVTIITKKSVIVNPVSYERIEPLSREEYLKGMKLHD